MILISDILFYSLLFVLIWFSTFTLFNVKRRRSISNHLIQHPPSPPALPLIGHLHLLGPKLTKSFQALAARYGPLIRLRLGSKNSTIIVSNAIIAKEILKDNEMNFVSRPELGSSEFNIYAGYTFIFAEYGTYWRFMKKMCMTELLSTQQVNRFADIRREERIKLLETLVNCCQEGKACDIGVQLVKLTNNIICRMTMSTTCSGSEDESKLVWEFVKGIEQLTLKFLMTELLGPVSKLDLFGYGKRLKSLIIKFDNLVEKIMAEHENNDLTSCKERKDIMDLLLQIYRDENSEVKLTNERVIFDLKAIMRDPNSWENPLDFLPERFITNSEGRYDHYIMEFRGQNFKIFPFGSGRRGCPGASLALAVIHGAIATLVQCFDFEVPNGKKLNMEEGTGIAGAMVHPLLCYPIMHLNPLELTHKNW
ncbi:hypothetical protein ACH5RR_002705 [Cinchona calisaya]|uniref:Cytochrome P450 n=1 Tax=Cinchona calisaya TaxID=153742 RepID=A0ABD3ATB1_9GENT